MNGETAMAPIPPHAIDRGSRLAFLAAAFAAVAIVVAFADTARSMVSIWLRSDVYTHGTLVVPICLWLAWRKRAELARVSAAPWWPGLAVIGACGFVWLLGSLANVGVVEQFALVLMLQAAVLTVLGPAAFRVLAAPLLFLLFAVPFGEELVPVLIEWTADVTVAALKLTGIPVYREGNNFMIPSGRWSVIEACSGIRFLIISLFVGCLFAYLTYRSVWRRAAFVLVSILTPILANWLRAYLIVLLGHLTNNRLETVIDHRLLGWILFGIVMFVVFWIGGRFADDPADAPPSPRAAVEARRPALAAAAVLSLAVAIVWLPLERTLAASANPDGPVSMAPIDGANGWQPVDDALEWSPRFGGYRATLRQAFERDGERVIVVVAWYSAQTQGAELVNSENVLVPATDVRWREVASRRADLATGDAPLTVRAATIRDDAGQFDVRWWYWIDGRTTTSDTVAKARLAWMRLSDRSDDSAAVFLFTEPSGDPARHAQAPATLARFAADMVGPIHQALAATAAGAAR